MVGRRKSLIAMIWFYAFAQPLPVHAFELTLPGPAERTASKSEARTSHRFPIGPFSGGSLPTALTEGALTQSAYRVSLTTASTLDLIQPLRAQLTDAGFDVIFECETLACGGFDFRYGIDVLPEPDMHVDLGDFRYLTARRSTDVVALMVSRTGTTGFVQVTLMGDAVTVAATTPASSTLAQNPVTAAPQEQPKAEIPVAEPALAGDLIPGLEQGLALPLEDLVFGSGSSALVEGEYPSLVQLAAWLKADPRRVVTLVGHTDASGGLQGNIRLSKLRAESVRQRLLFSDKVAPEQVRAEGVGSLAPRASNLTEEGRRKNRRVEVMVTSTELLGP